MTAPTARPIHGLLSNMNAKLEMERMLQNCAPGVAFFRGVTNLSEARRFAVGCHAHFRVCRLAWTLLIASV